MAMAAVKASVRNVSIGLSFPLGLI